jgi:hypothetical protein
MFSLREKFFFLSCSLLMVSWYIYSKKSFFSRHFVIMVPDWEWDFKVIPEVSAENTTSYKHY